jgi:hypothetical protein
MSSAELDLLTTTGGARLRPSPNQIFETLTAYHRTAALKAAIELDLFTAISNGKTTITSLAKGMGGSERGVRRRCPLAQDSRIARFTH